MALCQGPRFQIVRLYLVFTYIWLEDVAKIDKVPVAPRNVNPTPSIKWLVSELITIHCTIFQ